MFVYTSVSFPKKNKTWRRNDETSNWRSFLRRTTKLTSTSTLIAREALDVVGVVCIVEDDATPHSFASVKMMERHLRSVASVSIYVQQLAFFWTLFLRLHYLDIDSTHLYVSIVTCPLKISLHIIQHILFFHIIQISFI